MTIIRRPKRHDPKRHVALRCDKCGLVELFLPKTDFETVAQWVKDNSWRTIHRGGWLWDHRCPTCERLSRAPAEYWARIAS